MAEERGEMITMQDRLHGVGRTRQESLEYFSAVQNLEDARQAAEAARRLRAWEQHESDVVSADRTAPSEIDVRELEQIREKGMAARVQMSRDLRNRELAVAEARCLAAVDRRAEDPRRFGGLFS